jgi:manganese/zinc/iron transport system permease protein
MKPSRPKGAREAARRWLSLALGLVVGVLLLTGLMFWLGRHEGATTSLRVLLLLDYNTRLVVLSTSLMGVSSGLVGGYLLLRRRSLMGDALSHATLPGIALAFLVLVLLGGTGKHLGGLLLGASLAGILGVFGVMWMRRLPRIKEDTAMGVVLSVFYGAGIALLGLVQDLPQGSAAGLESFIYGKTASLVLQDFLIIVSIALLVLGISLLLFKEFRLLCFDEGFAASQGWPVKRLDLLLLVLACAVTVAGLQAVGLILIIAFLVIPAASARMWTSRLSEMLGLGAAFGGASGWIGASVSALLPRLPAGAVIVLVAAGIFLLSLLFGTDRGLLVRSLRHLTLKRRIERQHLLRGIYELLELTGEETAGTVPWEALLHRRSWNEKGLWKILQRGQRDGLLHMRDGGRIELTAKGQGEAMRVTRNHRLWELYLIEYADIAPNHVDRDADSVEHILGETLTRQLEALLPQTLKPGAEPVPSSPHQLEGSEA